MNWYAINNDVNFQKENTRTSSLEQSMKSPHVYDIGYQCLRNLVNVGSHQTILISGESGAGKVTSGKTVIISCFINYKSFQFDFNLFCV